MKFSLKTTLLNTKKSIERFPLTILLSAILAVLLIILTERLEYFNSDEIDHFNRVNMSIGLSVLISLNIKLLTEVFSFKKATKYSLYCLSGLGVFLYYLFLLSNFNFVSITRYIAVVLILILAFFFIPRLKKHDFFENYTTKIFSSLLITLVYSGVLIAGLFAILFTVNHLFDLSIDSKFYLYIFIFVSLIFSIALFLSKIPVKGENLDGIEHSKSLRILLLYIIIPLISVYTLILYIYFAKILITSDWPKGLVSHLVLWYSSISVGVLFLITPLTKKYNIAKFFKSIFPKVNIPLLVMMFMSIGIRINQYGITENRYYVCLLGLWILGIMIYYSFIKKSKNIIIPITLMITFFIAVFGPLSGYSFSIRSQNDRFNEILSENNMLFNGSIQANASIDKSHKQQISSIISYFESYHNYKDLEILPEDFVLHKMEDVFGFKYTHHSPYEADPFHSYTDLYGKPVDISDYDYYIHMSDWISPVINTPKLTITYDDYLLKIQADDELLFEKNINDYLNLIIANSENGGINNNTEETDLDDISFVEKTDTLELKLIFTSISGRRSPDTSLDNVEFILLIKIN